MRIGLMLSEAFNGLRRNATMVISVILVTFISLTFVGAAVLLQVQIGLMKGYWYDRAEVTVYLCNTGSSAAGCSGGAITDEQKTAVQDRLASATLAPYVQKLYFVDTKYNFWTYGASVAEASRSCTAVFCSSVIAPPLHPAALDPVLQR